MNNPSLLPHNQGTSMNEALHRATLLLAAFAVLLVLVLNIPDNRIIEAYTTQALVYVSLIAFAVFFGSRLSQGMITSAHVVGMVALLSLPEGAFPFMLWTTFFGAVGGIVIKRFYARTSGYSVYIADVIFTAAQVVLSFFAAGRVYIALDGSLPLESVSWDNNSSIFIALTAYVIVYVALYVAFFALRLFVEGKSVTKVARSNLSVLTIVLLLPVPFAIVSGEIANNLNQPVEILSLIGLALIILGLHTFSRSRYLFRKQLQEIQTFSDITRAMRSHLELPVLLMTIYQQVGKLLGIDNFVIALHVPERNRLEYPLAIVGGQETVVSMDKLPAVCADSLVSHVLETTEPLLLSDHVQTQAQGLNLAPPSDEIMSWIGAPLTAGGNTFGVIAAMSDSPSQHFSADDLRLLNIIASSASVAIENAQLYRRQKDRAEQLSTLSRVGALLSGTLSSDTVLDIVISSASTIADANSIAVYLFAGDDQTDLRLARSAGLTEVFTDNPPVPALVSDESAIRPYQPLAISDVMADKRGESLRTLMKHEHKQALVELPLVIGEDTLGIIALYYDDTQFFDSSRLEYMRTYATQAAQAIQNANTYSITDKAFQRSVDQLLTLATIGRELTSTVNLREICTSILDSVMRATRINVGLVALQDINGNGLQVLAQKGYPDNLFDDASIIEKSLTNEILKDGMALIVGDVRQDESYVEFVPSTKSQLSVPIMRGDEKLGIITLECDELNGFSEEDSHFIAQLANQAVIAIDNARLFGRITEARDRLQVILDTMEEAVILIDLKGKIALANPRIRMIGFDPAALIGQDVNALMAESRQTQFHLKLGFTSLKQLEAIINPLMESNGIPEQAPSLFTTQVEGVTHYIQRYVTPALDENQQTMGVLMVFYNKTEEQELTRARDELSRMIVHDLRSPLTAVTTSLRLLQEIVPKDNDAYPMVLSTTDASRRAVRKLLGRVNSLLDIAKLESGRMTIDKDFTEFSPIAEAVREELRPLSQELAINVRIEIHPETPLLFIDADKIERLLLNLVDNALKYSPMESELRIQTFAPGTSGAAEDFIRVDVADKGPGIPIDYKETLFESFVQVEGRKKVRHGVGLGLTFCKLAAEAHGGRIWIEDNPGGGSIFAFTLPIAKLERFPDDDEEELQIRHKDS